MLYVRGWRVWHRVSPGPVISGPPPTVPVACGGRVFARMPQEEFTSPPADECPLCAVGKHVPT